MKYILWYTDLICVRCSPVRSHFWCNRNNILHAKMHSIYFNELMTRVHVHQTQLSLLWIQFQNIHTTNSESRCNLKFKFSTSLYVRVQRIENRTVLFWWKKRWPCTNDLYSWFSNSVSSRSTIGSNWKKPFF